jgi:hypothetical protein
VYTPQYGTAGWMWTGRAITTAAAQSPKINLTNDAPNIERMDVNGDGLVDIVLSTGKELETFFALAKYPGGDGQFGSAQWSGPTSATVSNDPVASCLPVLGVPVSLSDSRIKIADMNGDGLPDIVRLDNALVRYLPGRGNGRWGTGDAWDCPGGTMVQGREIVMDDSPQISDPNQSDVRLDDVNGDGLDDLVQVRFNAVDVWLNVDGSGWTDRFTLANTPVSQPTQHRVRLVDVNGSGTRDILWGDGNQYRYIDLSGGRRPGLLTHVSNGLGKTTDLEYASSTEQMLEAELAKAPWASKSPTVVHVLSRVTENDNLQLIGRAPGKYVTDYRYRDPYYDGRQREFRGFRSVRVTKSGDANSPASTDASTFLLGECVDEAPPGTLPSPCTFAGRWRDNPREALKGLPQTVESFDANGVYQSTTHYTYRLRPLYQGLDGRDVRVAFESASDTWRYDVAAFDGQTAKVGIVDVELDPRHPPLDWRWDAHQDEIPVQVSCDPTSGHQCGSVTLRAKAGTARVHTAAQEDTAGNQVVTFDDGCIEGCARPDGRIAHFSFPWVHNLDSTGWGWRVWEEYVLGYGDYNDWEPRQHIFYSFDGRGDLINSARQIVGTLPLDRFHQDPNAPAPTAHDSLRCKAEPSLPVCRSRSDVSTARHPRTHHGWAGGDGRFGRVRDNDARSDCRIRPRAGCDDDGKRRSSRDYGHRLRQLRAHDLPDEAGSSLGNAGGAAFDQIRVSCYARPGEPALFDCPRLESGWAGLERRELSRVVGVCRRARTRHRRSGGRGAERGMDRVGGHHVRRERGAREEV